MISFQWDSNFETGLKEVDDQHQHLVDIINLFSDRMTRGRLNQGQLNKLITELFNYADYHFKEEESLMVQAGIDNRHQENHRRKHRDFLAEVTTLCTGIKPGDHTSLRHLLNFLIHWLVYHILGADRNLGRQVQAVRAGLDPALAYETEELDNCRASEPLVNALINLFDLLSTRNRQLLALNVSLEEKVAERTRELSTANQRLGELALLDSLTGLYNRRHAMTVLQSFWENSELSGNALACLMIDVDHFKDVNDTWGHDAGDFVLKELSRVMQYALRNDDVLCRLGGDEFFIICRSTDLQGAFFVAGAISNEVGQLVVPAGNSRWLGSVSVGVAEKTADMTRFEDLIKAADEGVYSAKKAGRKCVRSVQKVPE